MHPKYKDKRTERFAAGKRIKEFQAFERQAYKRLEILEAAPNKEALMLLPSNRFEALGGDRSGQYSIRINDKWRICFEWSQKEDLNSQREYVSSYYPQGKCISDIGSGLNFKRKKFLKLMEQVAAHEIKKIVVAHKDRLCRFGFDFVEWFCNLNGCQIEVLNHTYKSPHQELMDDFMAVMHCFSSKLYFLRSYEKKIRQEIDKTDKA